MSLDIDRLAQARIAKGLSPEALAAKAGMEPERYLRIEAGGEQPILLDTAQDIARTFSNAEHIFVACCWLKQRSESQCISPWMLTVHPVSFITYQVGDDLHE